MQKLPYSPNQSVETACERQRQVSEQIFHLREEIQQNGELISTLGQRLEPVRQTSPTTAGESKNAPEEYLVPLAAELRQLCRVVHSQNSDLRTVIEGIEL